MKEKRKGYIWVPEIRTSSGVKFGYWKRKWDKDISLKGKVNMEDSGDKKRR